MMNATASAGPSLVGLLARTPMRDAVRGRLTGRLDIDRLVARADLPPALGSVVRDVVRQTRLWRLERVEVAEELIAHFADGLDSGAESDDLVRSFGDTRAAARLIRRAKKRNRPRLWHAARWTLLGLAALVLLYIGIGVVFSLAEPRPSVDYRPQLNTVAEAVPEADRAWPLYRTALIALGDMPAFEGLSRTPLPGEDGWDEAVAYLDANRAALDLARTAAAKPGLGFIVRHDVAEEDFVLWPEEREISRSLDDLWDESLISILLPHLSELRRLAKVLDLDARRAAAAGDGDMVVANIDALMSLAVQVRETPIFINDLVALSIQSTAFNAVGRILADAPDALTDAHLLAIAHRLAATDEAMTVRFKGERMSFYDIVQRIYTDNGHGDGRVTLSGLRSLSSLTSMAHAPEDALLTDHDVLGVLALPVVNSIVLSRKDLLAEYDRLMDELEVEAKQPLWKREPSTSEEEVERWAGDPIQRLRHLPLVLLMPALSRATVNAELCRQARDATVTVVALELYRRRTGAWPASLDALVPELLPAVPVDRFDGEPLRYALGETGPVLYSIGANHADDGGVPPLGRYDDARRWRPAPALGAVDGDWVHWPAPLDPVVRYED